MARSVFTLKPLSALRTARRTSKPTFGAFTLTLLGIGCIMGTGVFVLPGQVAAHHTGPAVVLSFLLAALTAALGAMCYAEMATMLPVSGSAYVYAYATMGELPAFLMGWILALEYLIGAATVAGGWSGYVCAMLRHWGLADIPEALQHAPFVWDATQNQFVQTGAICNLPAMLIILLICAVLVRGTQESSWLNNIIVFIKIGVVLLFIGFALPHVQPDLWHPFIPENTGTFGQFGISGIFQGATMLFFSYLGFDAVSVAASETRNPRVDVPIGILASLSICAIIYAIIGAMLTGLVPYTQLGVSYPMALGVQATHQGWLESIVEIGAIAGLSSVLLVQLFAQPRIVQSISEDGFLPPILARNHPKYGTPYLLTWLAGILCALSAGFMPIDMLAEITSIGTLLAFAFVAIGVTRLRYKQPDWPRKFKVPGGAWFLPGLCVVISAALMYTSSLASFGYLTLWIILGFAIYVGYGRRRVGMVLASQTPRSAAPTQPLS